MTAFKTLHNVQLVRKATIRILLVVFFGLCMFSRPLWINDGSVELTIEAVSFTLLGICILGRTWSILFIAGRKNRILVTTGPYSITRNPLYLFSILGAIGVGLQMDSVVLGSIAGAVIALIFIRVIQFEEAALTAAHTPAFAEYKATVPRLLPRRAQWKSAEFVEIQPQIVVRSFCDSLWFLVAGPATQVIKLLQHHLDLPVLLQLP